MYQVQMQFIPGNDMIWVARLTPEDPIYEYKTQKTADSKATQLQAEDPTGRVYKVVSIAA